MKSFLALLILIATLTQSVFAEVNDEKVQKSEVLPDQNRDRVKVTEKFDNQVPLDLRFTNHLGREVALRDIIDGEKAIVLNLVYYNCPSICSEVLISMTQAAKNLPWTMGDNFKALTVSINPDETHPLAYRKRTDYVELYGKAATHDDWIFCTGSKEDIQILADATGFGFEKVITNERVDYVHPAVTILLSPEGKVMRYLEGFSITSRDLKLGLIDSGQGKVGTSIDQQLLKWCYAYDPKKGQYTLLAQRVMMGGGAVTFLIMATFMFFLWRRELRDGAIK